MGNKLYIELSENERDYLLKGLDSLVRNGGLNQAGAAYSMATKLSQAKPVEKKQNPKDKQGGKDA